MEKRESFFTEKNINNLKIVLISDIHYSYSFRLSIFDTILNQVKEIEPDYIFIVGDLIDCRNVDYSVLEKFLRKLEKYSKIFIVFGNHELYDYSKNKRKKEIVKDNLEFRDVIKKLDNCYLLDNDTYIDSKNNISVTGINLSNDYYINDESLDIFIKELRSKKISLDMDKYNILLIHSPCNIYEDNVKKYLDKFDLVLSGHMHAGLVHPLVSIFFKKNAGLISPKGQWFPNLVCGRIDTKYFDSYIYEGITKLSRSSGKFLNYLDFLYPKRVKEINIERKK